MPLTATAQNTAQDRYPSLPPPARITIVGMKTMLARPRTTSCRPQPKLRAGGGFSSAWYRMLVSGCPSPLLTVRPPYPRIARGPTHPVTPAYAGPSVRTPCCVPDATRIPAAQRCRSVFSSTVGTKYQSFWMRSGLRSRTQ